LTTAKAKQRRGATVEINRANADHRIRRDLRIELKGDRKFEDNFLTCLFSPETLVIPGSNAKS
jgi:hypothetical protein